MRPILWLMEPTDRCNRLANFLQQLLEVREVLANRALHLFLQTKLSVKVILLCICEQVIQLLLSDHKGQPDGQCGWWSHELQLKRSRLPRALLNLYEILLKRPGFLWAYWKVIWVDSNDSAFYEKPILLLEIHRQCFWCLIWPQIVQSWSLCKLYNAQAVNYTKTMENLLIQ